MPIPAAVNWYKRGAVTRVKNQRNCSSCWAFAAAAALESHHFLKTGRLVPLSEQNLVDCSRKYGNSGCHGGNTKKAYQYVKENKGIDTEKSYPYQAKTGQCRYQPKYSGATAKGYTKIARSETILQQAVATRGPVAIVADARGKGFRFYRSGVYYNNHCSSKRLNHAMLVVGYGRRYQGNYWLVKNSWGATWGIRGYILMARNRNNNCGIATRATFPTV